MNRREREAWLIEQWARRRLAAREGGGTGPTQIAPGSPPVLNLNRGMAGLQLRRSAAAVDLQAARCSRWADTLGLLNRCAPEYLVPLLSYALGAETDAASASPDEYAQSGEDGENADD
jgi:hypothetical protein